MHISDESKGTVDRDADRWSVKPFWGAGMEGRVTQWWLGGVQAQGLHFAKGYFDDVLSACIVVRSRVYGVGGRVGFQVGFHSVRNSKITKSKKVVHAYNNNACSL